MRSAPLAALALLAACAPPRSAPVPTSGTEAEVVAAERAFAAAAARDGIRDAFLAFSHDSALALRPEPANAKELWRGRARTSARLSWYPAFARGSGSGDMGFTTGPYEAADSAGTVQGHGHYVTVWRKMPEGWRFAIDVGTPHPRPDRAPAAWRAPGHAETPVRFGVDAGAEPSLLAADSGFAARAAADGLAAALRAHGDPEMRLLRPGALPHVGLAASLAAAAADSARRYTAQLRAAMASNAGDLGWTWGEYQSVHPGAGRRETGYYVRIWTRQPGAEWRLLLDVVAPRPPERDE
ncbi:MAG TPA: DUF4440 domain-containing protein [Longimicrobium sp.]|nr:DUF4440 domain-containing protein [Longimicrobium sp.]